MSTSSPSVPPTPLTPRAATRRALHVSLLVFITVALGTLVAQGPSVRPAAECMVDTWHTIRAAPWVGAAVAAVIAYRLMLKRMTVQLKDAAKLVGEGPYRQNIVPEATALARPKAHEALLAGLVLLGGGIGALQARSYASCKRPIAEACTAAKAPLHDSILLVPVGEVDSQQIEAMRAHFAGCYPGLAIRVGEHYEPHTAAWDYQRKQWQGEILLDDLKEKVRLRTRTIDGSQPLIIGVTAADIFTARQNWSFAFSVRAEGVALVSYSRMGGILPGTMTSRLQKMLAKTVAVQYCGLPMSENSRSIRYGSILSLSDLDGVDESVW